MGITLCLQRTAYMGMLPTCKCSRCTFHLLCHRDSSCVTPHRAVALLALITSVGDALWGLEAMQLLSQPAALPRAGCIWVAEAEHSFPSIGSLSHWITTATTGSSLHPRVSLQCPPFSSSQHSMQRTNSLTCRQLPKAQSPAGSKAPLGHSHFLIPLFSLPKMRTHIPTRTSSLVILAALSWVSVVLSCFVVSLNEV